MKKILYILTAIIVVVTVGFYAAAKYYLYSGPYVLDQCNPSETYTLDVFYSELDEYIKSFHDPNFKYNLKDVRGHFSITPGGSTDLYGACDMVYVFWILDELEERTTAEGRAHWANLIRSYQDPETGRFDRGNLSGESSTHATAFATAALKLLGSSPKYPHTWAEDIFSTPEQVDAWLDSFSWNEVWTGSHEAGAAAAVIDAPGGIDLPDNWDEMVLTAFTRRVDPRTGFWKNGILDPVLQEPTTVDLGGAAHFWWIYDHPGKSIPYPEKVIPGILELQRETGLWGARVFNGAFPQGIDFDAVNGMRIAWKSVSPQFRRENRGDIISALDRYACAAHYHLNHEGALEKYRKVHKIVGTLNTIAEVNMLYRELTGKERILTKKRWRSSLATVCWQ